MEGSTTAQRDGVLICASVRLFAGAAEAIGARSLEYSLRAGSTLSDLVNLVASDHPAIAAMRPSLRFAVNHEFAAPEGVLSDGDEVAVIPPVSGG